MGSIAPLSPCGETHPRQIHNEERGECARRDPEEKREYREKFGEKVREALEKGEPLPTESEYFSKEELFVSCPVELVNKPFLTMPTSCNGETLTTAMAVNSWEEPGRFVPASTESPKVIGCEKLSFGPSLVVHPAQPETTGTGLPTGLEVDLKIPQDESLADLAKSDVKEAVVTLPTGVTISPSAANGLDVCPLLGGKEPAKEEKEHNKEDVGIDLESAQPANCPPGSKLGSVEVLTPLLAQPLRGSVYVAQQGNLPGAGANPFGSLFALYLVAEGNGAIIKLPGKIELDEATGQVSARFGEDPTTGFYLPQLPFSELKMTFFGGPRAPLVTPSSCGTYTTRSQLTPWDGNPAAEPGSSFAISSGCGAQGFSPTLTAGTTNPQAGRFSDEAVTIARNDGEQNLSGVTVTTPPGLLGMLSKVPLCQEPQASQGTCGETSSIGETMGAVGPGEDPYWVKGGRVYLTGPYDHEPFGLSIVVPTVAGPFTLKGEHGGVGREVVRASIAVNPKTGALTIASGPLPSMLEGVPLDVRTINVDINRSGFTFNPTDCEELQVTSAITSTRGATATPPSRFQAANCAALPFKPSLLATTRGNGSDRVNGASLNVKVTQRTGEAGIRSVHLELPEKLPARLSTLQKACTEATFDANPANCPPSSDVGTGIAHTPVLPVPLEGPAYFVLARWGAVPGTGVRAAGRRRDDRPCRRNAHQLENENHLQHVRDSARRADLELRSQPTRGAQLRACDAHAERRPVRLQQPLDANHDHRTERRRDQADARKSRSPGAPRQSPCTRTTSQSTTRSTSLARRGRRLADAADPRRGFPAKLLAPGARPARSSPRGSRAGVPLRASVPAGASATVGA